MVTKANNNKSSILGVILPLHHSLACFFFSFFACLFFFRSKVCNILMKTHCSQPEDLASSAETDLYHFELIAYIILHILDNLMDLLSSRLSSQVGRARTGFWMEMKADDLNFKIHISPTTTCQNTHVAI